MENILQKKTSIIILSCNTCDYTQLCIESIRQHTRAGSYELIVIENGSSDGSVEWLKQQKDIRLLCNTENMGFPKGCNQGLRLAKGDDLLLLNSDTMVTPNWLDNLRTALYSRDNVGAVSCVTNRCSNLQQIPVPYDDAAEAEDFAARYNKSDSAKWQEWLTLVGFCFLLKREVYAVTGGLDERFSPGNFEDDDLSLRIRQDGYSLLLCRDTFIHHFGSASFLAALTPEQRGVKQEKWRILMQHNQEIFLKKWGFTTPYKRMSRAIPMLLKEKLSERPRILELDCGCGFDLFLLAKHYPDAMLTGVTMNAKEAAVQQVFRVDSCRDLEKEADDYLSGKYDVIILAAGRSILRDAETFRAKLENHLTENGLLFF